MPRFKKSAAFPPLELPRAGGDRQVARRRGGRLRSRARRPRPLVPVLQRPAPGLRPGREMLADAGVRVVAMSVNNEATVAALADKLQLPFPVAHRADAGTVAAALGCYVHERPPYLESTSFMLGPDSRVGGRGVHPAVPVGDQLSHPASVPPLRR